MLLSLDISLHTDTLAFRDFPADKYIRVDFTSPIAQGAPGLVDLAMQPRRLPFKVRELAFQAIDILGVVPQKTAFASNLTHEMMKLAWARGGREAVLVYTTYSGVEARLIIRGSK
jgi:hypothetical protein